MTLPTFFIVGANKAGTTALYYHLRRHPQIWMSRVKEPQHFASSEQLEGIGPGDERATIVRSVDAYEKLFEAGDGSSAIGEGSTIYLYDEASPALIRDRLPDSKIVAILRDPVARAYSNYLHLVRDGREELTDFNDALDAEPARLAAGWSANWAYTGKGFYAPQVARYKERFPDSQLRWYSYDDFDRDPASTLLDLYDFLGVDRDLPPDLSLRLNVGGVPKVKAAQTAKRHQERIKWAIDPLVPAWLRRWGLNLQTRGLSRPEIPAGARRRLLDMYHDDIVQTGELTGLNVSNWLEDHQSENSAPVESTETW